jgi:hypothetical protein
VISDRSLFVNKIGLRLVPKSCFISSVIQTPFVHHINHSDPKRRSSKVAIIVVSTLFTKRQFETDWRIRAAAKSTRPVTKRSFLASSRLAHCRHVRKLERKHKLALEELRRIDREIDILNEAEDNSTTEGINWGQEEEEEEEE